MVRANICPSIYQRTDAQTFWNRGGFLQPFTHDNDDEREILLLPLADPLFFRNHVANGLEPNPFPAPTPLSNNKISTIFARDHRIETRVRVCKDETTKNTTKAPLLLLMLLLLLVSR